MSLSSEHPLYTERQPEYVVMEDTYAGETRIKNKGVEYLPPTTAQRLDGMGSTEKGGLSYAAYKTRAIFHDFVKDAVQNYLGLLHQKPPTISVPEKMKPLLDHITTYGENAPALLRRINENQLLLGRCGLLLDLPVVSNANTLPYIALYNAKSIINWDDSIKELGNENLNLVVLNESGMVRNPNGFDWVEKEKYRVLSLGVLDVEDADGTAVYKQGVFESETFDESQMQTIQMMGKTLSFIPFEFVNSADTTTIPRSPPLLGLAKLCLAIYRGEADYRQSLHMQGQDTLIVIGNRVADKDEDIRVGAGARIDVNLGGDAKYIGVDGSGLSEQRQALVADKQDALLRSGQFIGTKQSTQESGEAMKTRIGSRTATLNEIALAGAYGLETILKKCASWMGLDENEVSVRPNTDFAKGSVNGQDLVQITTSRNLGAPLSQESIHQWCVENGLTTKSFEEEMEKIVNEIRGKVAPMTAIEDTTPLTKQNNTTTGVKDLTKSPLDNQ